ncbi:response regulator [Hymenobacter coccineus]|uniref:Response regulatory domain-containing protein n=1 Tax=Hymenobacter coccineus TaxID=1908235 RepID=A0A1G1TK45_9BACT|nr:response regulator [Hymenobacter coccineus]OGX91232.1 hypothetical protein BEN49_05335 [Hymenobacter coccineus]
MLSTVLLVDDDPTTNFINERLLRRLNVSHEVLVATNGRLGLDLLAKRCGEESVGCPALVLLDMKMPVMSGLEFLEVFMQLPLRQQHPIVIVLLTSTQLEQDLGQHRHLPVTDYLTKPLTPEKITHLLSQYFNNEHPLN